MISLIVAVAKNNVIGNNGIIPWKIKGEQKRFKELTTEICENDFAKTYEERIDGEIPYTYFTYERRK